MNLTKEMWEKYERGDGLKLEEVRALIKQTEDALPYLHDRSHALGTLPTSDAALTLHRLRGFETALALREKKPA